MKLEMNFLKYPLRVETQYFASPHCVSTRQRNYLTKIILRVAEKSPAVIL